MFRLFHWYTFQYPFWGKGYSPFYWRIWCFSPIQVIEVNPHTAIQIIILKTFKFLFMFYYKWLLVLVFDLTYMISIFIFIDINFKCTYIWHTQYIFFLQNIKKKCTNLNHFFKTNIWILKICMLILPQFIGFKFMKKRITYTFNWNNHGISKHVLS